MKKLLSIMLAILMIVTTVPLAFAADDYKTVYFKNTDNWTNVNVFYWNDLSAELTLWPGDAMTDEDDGIWSYDIPAEAAYVIFNNGSSQTDDIILPTDGKNLYDYSADEWSVYEATEGYIAVYFKNTDNWSEVNIYGFNSDGTTAGLGWWPGTAMSIIEGEEGYYKYIVPVDTYGLVFNDGASKQTADLTLPTDGKNLYDYESGVWTDYGTTCSHSGGTQTCKGYECESCGEWYGEADENAHDWSNLDGVCANGCGEKCPHENFSEGKCHDCTVEGKKLTITMNDSFGDGWNDNAVIIKKLVDGEYEEIGRATFDDGESYTHAEVISEEDIYILVWDKGRYAGECSFTVDIDGETVFETDYCNYYESGEILYVICDHIYTNSVCSICGFECGKDYAHIYSSETGICACGSECEHVYKDSEICNVCGMQCPHKEYTAIPIKLTPAIDSASVGVTVSEEIEELFDGDVRSKWCSAFDENNLPYAIFHFEKAVKLMSYTLITGIDSDLYPQRNWVSWTIYGSDSADGEWTVVHQVTNARLPVASCAETDAFEVNADTAYQYYKLVIDGNGGYDSWGCTQQMAEMNIFTDVTYIGCADCGEACLHDNYTDGVCDTCGYECPHDNYTKGYCDVCEYPCFHSFTDFTETVAPKCEETGWKESYCDYDCGIKLEQEIPALDHDWVSGGVERPVQNIDLSWSDGYYYDTCKNDATHINITGVAKRGDYEKLNELLVKAKAYYADETLTDEAKAEIAKIINLPIFGYMPQNLIETELNVYIGLLDNVVTKTEAGIEDGTLVKVDGDKIGDEANKKWAEKLEAEGLMDEYEDFIYSQKITDEALATLDEMDNFLDSLEGTVAENAENIAKFNEMFDSFIESLENCLRGTHNFKDYETTTPAKCEANAKETGTCWFCGETDEREVEGTALTHSFTTYEEVEAPKCGVAGKKVATCDRGCGATDEKEIPALTHIWGEYKSNGDASCTADGTKTAECERGCGKTDTVTDEGTKLPHTNEDDDGNCDVCGGAIYDCVCGKEHKNIFDILICFVKTVLDIVFGNLKAKF